jgi:adenosylcobyric acid synthase
VAPFKAQNIALNSAVTPDGAEIGRAQAAQAQAAGVAPEAAMNPILLKPTGEGRAQVVLMGHPLPDADVNHSTDLRARLQPVVLEALAELRSRFDVVICEGSGSLAEINLRERDISNMGLARAADLPVVVIGDIERGGVFASLFGSLALLDPLDQKLVAGFLVNRFRGAREMLTPGLVDLHARAGRPVLGVLPWLPALWLDAEDHLGLEAFRDSPPAEPGEDPIHVTVLRLPSISNFTDFDALACEPGIEIRFTKSPHEVREADLAVLPGTKATVNDLTWLRSRALDEAVRARADAGKPVLGICGGYQILGERIVDRIESGAGEVKGLGILPVETVFGEDKVLGRPAGVSRPFGNVAVSGYEIHHGRIQRFGGDALLETSGREEGCIVGSVVGTSWHGLFDEDHFRRAFLSWVAEARGLGWSPGAQSFLDLREQRLDRLGDLIEEHVDTDALGRLIEWGAPPMLPSVRPELISDV